MIVLQSPIFKKIIKLSSITDTFQYNSEIYKNINFNSNVKIVIFVSRGELKNGNRS